MGTDVSEKHTAYNCRAEAKQEKVFRAAAKQRNRVKQKTDSGKTASCLAESHPGRI
jgi:hypothetical protein